MTSARWWSQPFPPTGAITSEGIRNQLGRPPVDPLTVFVRETAQNSWDARVGGREVGYRLDLTRVSPAHRPAWRDLLGPRAPVDRHHPLTGTLRADTLRLLTVSDRGTLGLGGPTRADRLSDDRSDWVSFVLNVGAKRDVEFGGGTYGYGKAVLYRLSRAGTVLVHTRTANSAGDKETRLIGVTMGDSFDTAEHRDARPYTGRHWWGLVHDDHVEPLVGADAEAVARRLGLTPFGPDETGTGLVVIDPDLSEFESERDAAEHLAQTVAWHTWPIMLVDRGERRLAPSVSVDGLDVPVPDPARTYPLRTFVEAYRQAMGEDGSVLACGNPKRNLGRFGLVRKVVKPMSEDGTTAAAYAGVPRDVHHVCLMRSPELVVTYFAGPQPVSPYVAYAGVFRAGDDLDEVYAAAEPPTHDGWVSEQLSGNDRRFVRTTFTRITEQLAQFKRSAAIPPADGGVPLGAAGAYLGDLIAAAFDDISAPRPSGRAAAPTSGSGPGGDSPTNGVDFGSGPGPNNGRVRVTPVDDPQVVERDDGTVVIVQRWRCDTVKAIELAAELRVAVTDGYEDQPPVGAELPSVHSWSTADGEVRSTTCTVHGPAEVELRVLHVPDTLTDITVTGRSVEQVD